MEAYWGDASTNKEPQGLRPPPEARRVGSPERAWPCGRPASGSGLGRGGGSSRCPRPGVRVIVGRLGSWRRTPGPRPAALAPAGLPRLARGSPWKSPICPLRGVRVHVGGSGRVGAVSPVMVQAARPAQRAAGQAAGATRRQGPRCLQHSPGLSRAPRLKAAAGSALEDPV